MKEEKGWYVKKRTLSNVCGTPQKAGTKLTVPG